MSVTPVLGRQRREKPWVCGQPVWPLWSGADQWDTLSKQQSDDTWRMTAELCPSLYSHVHTPHHTHIHTPHVPFTHTIIHTHIIHIHHTHHTYHTHTYTYHTHTIMYTHTHTVYRHYTIYTHTHNTPPACTTCTHISHTYHTHHTHHTHIPHTLHIHHTHTIKNLIMKLITVWNLNFLLTIISVPCYLIMTFTEILDLDFSPWSFGIQMECVLGIPPAPAFACKKEKQASVALPWVKNQCKNMSQ